MKQGVYGAYFSKLNYRWSRYIRGETWVKRHPVVEVLLVPYSLYISHSDYGTDLKKSTR